LLGWQDLVKTAARSVRAAGLPLRTGTLFLGEPGFDHGSPRHGPSFDEIRGTSVADLDRIRVVARHVRRELDRGHEVAVVVSAMAGETNKLVALCRGASVLHDAREYDSVVASGEQVTAGLLAIVLQSMGVNARSWSGWQLPIRTDSAHGAARISDIRAEVLTQRFAENQVAVIAGFQGVAPDNRVATLGRGGSDTSAVAIAAAIGADRCDIYTDVDGVYTTDPRIVSTARRLDKVAYEEMLRWPRSAPRCCRCRSVELAMVHGVRTLVRSSFDDPDNERLGPDGEPLGTLICDEDEIVEKQLVTGIAYSKDEAKITLRAWKTSRASQRRFSDRWQRRRSMWT
jgi:aspartate kinase